MMCFLLCCSWQCLILWSSLCFNATLLLWLTLIQYPSPVHPVPHSPSDNMHNQDWGRAWGSPGGTGGQKGNPPPLSHSENIRLIIISKMDSAKPDQLEGKEVFCYAKFQNFIQNCLEVPTKAKIDFKLYLLHNLCVLTHGLCVNIWHKARTNFQETLLIPLGILTPMSTYNEPRNSSPH